MDNAPFMVTYMSRSFRQPPCTGARVDATAFSCHSHDQTPKMLLTTPTRRASRYLVDMWHGHTDPGSDALSSLMTNINNKPGSSITSAINATTVDLLCKLVSKKDYISDAERLEQSSDVENLLDFILCLLHDPRFPPRNTSVNVTHRARRFMLKVVSKMPVIPSSLVVTGVTMPAERNYIGGGGFGRVFKGVLKRQVVALKVLYRSDNQVAFCREALMWRSLKHKFVLPFLGIHEIGAGTTPQFFLVSPYMKNGTLSKWRKRKKPSTDDIEERILEVAQGMEYIHSEGVVHGDLRGENVLLDNRLHVQIADFGLTRLSDATKTRSGAFHPNFAAPELFGALDVDDGSSDDEAGRSQASDVYAFGSLYYEIHYDNIPYAGKSNLQILALVSRGILPPRIDDRELSDEAWDVIRGCWTREPRKRPIMKHVVASMKAMSFTTPARGPSFSASNDLLDELPVTSPPLYFGDNPVICSGAAWEGHSYFASTACANLSEHSIREPAGLNITVPGAQGSRGSTWQTRAGKSKKRRKSKLNSRFSDPSKGAPAVESDITLQNDTTSSYPLWYQPPPSMTPESLSTLSPGDSSLSPDFISKVMDGHWQDGWHS